MYVGYAEAVNFGLDITEEEWESGCHAAKAIVDGIVGLNEVTDYEAYANAVCAAYAQISDGGLCDSPNMSIGGFSIGSTTGNRESARQAALDFLVPAGLAYMGV